MRSYTAPNDGPNGVAVAGGRVYGATDTTAFALDARTGRRLWSRRLTRKDEQFVDIAPVVAGGRVYLSTVGFPPGGRGALYGVDARTGAIIWRFGTVRDPWPQPGSGGGGAWYPLSVDRAGRVYAGISNPGPWGGTPRFPNGSAFGESTLYTDALVVLAGRSGKLLWFDQVLRRDIRDYDFQASPILATVRRRGRATHMVFGAGKGGRVVAWNRDTRRRLWSQSVGTHLNDLGPLPRRPVTVCPGLFGGVLTPMAYAAGRLFVPVVELCMKESAIEAKSVLQRPAAGGKGVLYGIDAASGRKAWSHRFGSPLFGCATVARDVVFAPSYDGTVTALAARTGRSLWSTRLRAGINACPAVAEDRLFVAAGAPHPAFPVARAELVAYGIPSTSG